MIQIDILRGFGYQHSRNFVPYIIIIIIYVYEPSSKDTVKLARTY